MTTTIRSFVAMSDASGAPAVIESGGLAWAFDMLGEMKCSRIWAGSGFVARGLVKASRAKAEAAYRAELARHTDATWRARNALWYPVAQ
jgi:hypothetical protein